MNKLLTVLLVSVVGLAGCSTTKNNAPVEAPGVSAIQSQKLSTNFSRRGIKLEYDCKWYTVSCSETALKSIEVTAFAPSYGNTESNLETAYTVAEMNAKAKLRRFINEDISTSSVTHTISKNIEKANDVVRRKIGNGSTIAMTEEEAAAAGTASRDNNNEVVRTVTDTVRMNAVGILKGVRVIEERVVDRQTVQVTIRWDAEGEAAAQFLSKKFNKR